MALTVTDIKAIAAHGGGMVLDSRKYTVTDLKAIVAHARGKESRIFLNNVEALTAIDLKAIAAHGGGSVVFDLT